MTERTASHVYGKDTPPYCLIVEAVREAADRIYYEDEVTWDSPYEEGPGQSLMYAERKMIIKSNYYSEANLERLRQLAVATDRTEASLLQEALDDVLGKYRDALQ